MPSNAVGQEKAVRDVQIGKEKAKLIPLADDEIIYLGNPGEFNKVSGCILEETDSFTLYKQLIRKPNGRKHPI